MITRQGKIERVTSPSGGLVEEILVEPGTTVDAGELLIKLDTEEYDIRTIHFGWEVFASICILN